MTKHSISAIHRITGKSRTTITKHMNTGKLSWEHDATGAKVVDAAELMRCYGADACDFSKEEGSHAFEGHGLSGIEHAVQPDVYTLRLQLEKEVAERERERMQYRAQIEDLNAALKLAQEGHNKAMLLIEHSAKSSVWEKAIERLEARIANQEISMKSELAQAVKQTKSQALAEIKDRPWWQVAFARKETAA